MKKTLEKYLSYRNDKVISLYQNKFDLSAEEAETHFVELLKFLYVCSHKTIQVPYSPSIIIDEVWHIFLSFPSEYKTFCLMHFDKELHHQEGISHKDYYNAAKSNITNLFGVVSPTLRPSTNSANFRLADCSNE